MTSLMVAHAGPIQVTSVLGKPTLLCGVKAVPRLRFGVVRFHHRPICSRLVIFCRRRRDLGRRGGLACRGLGALGGPFGPSGGVRRLPGGCFRIDSGFLGGRGGSYRSSGDRRRLVRGH